MHGVLGTSRQAGTSSENWIPEQLLGFAVSGQDYEVLDLAGGGRHAIALTTLHGRDSRDEPRRTIVWGDNSKGQIGQPEKVETTTVLPRRLLRSLFPLYPGSNVIDSTNNRVCVNIWNFWNATSREIHLTPGVRSAKDIERDINEQMGADYIHITTDEDSERVSVQVIKSGVQFDFLTPGCRALADRFSFSRAYFKLPAMGLLGEVPPFQHCLEEN